MTDESAMSRWIETTRAKAVSANEAAKKRTELRAQLRRDAEDYLAGHYTDLDRRLDAFSPFEQAPARLKHDGLTVTLEVALQFMGGVESALRKANALNGTFSWLRYQVEGVQDGDRVVFSVTMMRMPMTTGTPVATPRKIGYLEHRPIAGEVGTVYPEFFRTDPNFRTIYEDAAREWIAAYEAIDASRPTPSLLGLDDDFLTPVYDSDRPYS